MKSEPDTWCRAALFSPEITIRLSGMMNKLLHDSDLDVAEAVHKVRSWRARGRLCVQWGETRRLPRHIFDMCLICRATWTS